MNRRADSDHRRDGTGHTAGTRYTAWFGPMRSLTDVLQVNQQLLVRTPFGSWLLRGVEQATFEDQGHGTR